jgi:integrase
MSSIHTNSVSIPPAQSDKLCDVGEGVMGSRAWVVAELGRIRLQSVKLYLCSDLLLTYGLRVSEVLSLTGSDISKSGRVRVISKKNSEIRVIHHYELCHYFAHLIGSRNLLFSEYDRFYIYRVFRRQGLSGLFGENKNKSVTHLGRHLVGLDISDSFGDVSVVKSYLGHKSINSSNHYVTNQK